ncbi:hypothetical protein BN77_p10084 [Rhizobium mesoamericanum STM3625]|uniref:Uncharacterized protein n=1 Tax=Rhizobium mesoamericanum STM3625 TaxID=1211777 RepID=K0Q511_9HYPH|nr:hypothetical protein BN77_p10084 [Rhizobium mesoamericanum STM3625]
MILSGSDGDGTLRAKAIREAGGFAAEQHQKVLINELNLRVKNLLVVWPALPNAIWKQPQVSSSLARSS